MKFLRYISTVVVRLDSNVQSCIMTFSRDIQKARINEVLNKKSCCVWKIRLRDIFPCIYLNFDFFKWKLTFFFEEVWYHSRLYVPSRYIKNFNITFGWTNNKKWSIWIHCIYFTLILCKCKCLSRCSLFFYRKRKFFFFNRIIFFFTWKDMTLTRPFSCTNKSWSKRITFDGEQEK